MLRSVVLPSLCLLLLLSACDTQSDDATKSNFLPITVGRIWTYNYSYAGTYGGSAPADSAMGTLTWTVESVDSHNGISTYSVTEIFSGFYRDQDLVSLEWADRQPSGTSRAFTIQVEDDQVLMDLGEPFFSPFYNPWIKKTAELGTNPDGIDWTDRPVDQYYFVTQDSLVESGNVTLGPVSKHTWTLKKDKGISFMEIEQNAHESAGTVHWKIELQE